MRRDLKALLRKGLKKLNLPVFYNEC